MKNLLKIFKKDNTEEGLATYEELHDSHYNLNNEVGLINEKLKDLGKHVFEHKDDLKNDVKKLNSRVTDLHEAYRVLLQNVNKLQKEVQDGNPNDYGKLEVHLYNLDNDLDKITKDLHIHKIETKDDFDNHNWRLDKLEDKVLGDDSVEYSSTNPGQIYLEAKAKFNAVKSDLLNTEIGYFEWTVRAANCFVYLLKIKTLKDLCSYSEKSLLKTKNLGQKTLNEIKSVLAKYDLKLREEDDLDE